MKLKEILEIVNGKEVYVDNEGVYDIDFKSAFGSDLMSDALICFLTWIINSVLMKQNY